MVCEPDGGGVGGRRFGGFSVRLGFFGGGVVDFGVGARGAGRDGEEFVEGEDAGFAAFPACGVIQ